MRSAAALRACALFLASAVAMAALADEQIADASASEEGRGRAHMDISCAPSVAPQFDRALGLLHNFWYERARSVFMQVIAADRSCAIAYWGAAMTYYQPFAVAPTAAEVATAGTLVQQGLAAKILVPRDKLYLNALAAFFISGGGKTVREDAYRDAMALALAGFPDDESKTFYSLAILVNPGDGAKASERLALAAKLLEEVFAHAPRHPGAAHYLIRLYDDALHAEQGLEAARAYAKIAPTLPAALHLPSHIFTRLGYWDDVLKSNARAWDSGEADVVHGRLSTIARDFHALNFQHYAYLQLGRFHDAERMLNVIATEYASVSDRVPAPTTSDLQSRHLRGRAIDRDPDRVIYTYFDMLARHAVESADWNAAASVPIFVAARDFVATTLLLQARAATAHKDVAAAIQAAAQLARLAQESGQYPIAKQIVGLHALEAAALAAQAAGNRDQAIAKMKEAVALEDAIDDLAVPPYPAIPANELFGTMLMEMQQPAAAEERFLATLKRSPGRPRAIFGVAQAAAATGDTTTAAQSFRQFLALWKHADDDRPELKIAQEFLDRSPATLQ